MSRSRKGSTSQTNIVDNHPDSVIGRIADFLEHHSVIPGKPIDSKGLVSRLCGVAHLSGDQLRIPVHLHHVPGIVCGEGLLVEGQVAIAVRREENSLINIPIFI